MSVYGCGGFRKEGAGRLASLWGRVKIGVCCLCYMAVITVIRWVGVHVCLSHWMSRGYVPLDALTFHFLGFVIAMLSIQLEF